MQDNNERDFSQADFVYNEADQENELVEYGDEAQNTDSVGSDGQDATDSAKNDEAQNTDSAKSSESRRTEFLRDGADFASAGGAFGASAYQSFGDVRRWDSFSLDDEKKAKSKFSRFFLSAFIYLMLANVLMIAFQLALFLTQKPEVAQNLIQSPTVGLVMNAIILYAICFPILYLFVRKMKFVPRFKTKLAVKEIFLYTLMGMALVYVGSFIGTTISEYIRIIFNISYQSSSDWISDAPIWLLIPMLCVIGPIFEELIFRKLLMDRLGTYGDRIVILVSAISFALYHGTLEQLFTAFAFGLLLAFIYSKTGNVIYTIIIHGAINLIGTAIPLLLSPFLDKFEAMLPTLEEAMASGSYEALNRLLTENMLSVIMAFLYSSILTGIVIAGAVILILRLRRKKFFISDRCEVFIPKQRRGAVIFLNAGVMLFIILCSATIIYDVAEPVISAAISNIGGGAA